MTLTDATRTALQTLIDHEERQCGSRNVAYENVAKRIKASPSWVRQWTSKYPGVSEPRLTLFESIRHAYVQMCVHIELEQQLEKQRITLLRSALHETDLGTSGVVRRPHHAVVS
jgi:hypothetical protein